MIRLRLILAILTGLVASPGIAEDTIAIDYDCSTLSFEVQSGANEIQGRFTSWNADFQFSPQDPEQTTISVEVDTTTAQTGNALVDSVLHTGDWLDSAQFGTAQFVSEAVAASQDGTFFVTGHLTLKGQRHPLVLSIRPLGPAPDASAPAVNAYEVSGALDRRQFDLGADFDQGAASHDVRIIARVFLIP